jgi:hypothetical protein
MVEYATKGNWSNVWRLVARSCIGLRHSSGASIWSFTSVCAQVTEENVNVSNGSLIKASPNAPHGFLAL